MYQKKISENQASAWLASALAVPLARTAADCSWVAAGTVGAVCAAVCWGVRKMIVQPGPWLRRIQCLWICVLISELLHWSGQCWTDKRGEYVIPLVLLALGLWAVWGGRGKAIRTGCTLLWPMLLPLGAVLLSSIPQVSLKELLPTWKMAGAHMVWVLLLPVFSTMESRGRGGRMAVGLAVLALTASVAAGSVLPPDERGGETIYELSRSISLFGVAERFESLTASGLTIGYFSAVAFLLDAQTKGEENRKKVVVYGLLSATLFLSGLRPDSGILALGSILLGVILPTLLCRKKISKKMEKPLDK